MIKRISDFNIQLYNSWCEAKSELSLAEYSYQKGRADAIDELSDLIDRLLWNYDIETYKDLSEGFKESAKLLKGQKND